MSQQQVQRLQTLLETVQRNRQRPGQPLGAGGNVATANVVQKKAPANTTASAAAEPTRARVATPELPVQPPAAAPAAAAPARPAKPQPQAPAQATGGTQPKIPPRVPEPQPAPAQVAQEPIVPRTIEPDVPRAATRPIAQLVSKHAPVVDATFGAMLKRSLSLRPH